jgi:hypothetical protein
MEYVGQFLGAVHDYMQTGYYEVNAIQGLLIAIATAYFLPSWKQLFIYAVGAVLAHVALDVMVPVLAQKGKFELPKNLLDIEYWRYLLALYIGFLIIIPIFYLVKILVLRGGHGSGGH